MNTQPRIVTWRAVSSEEQAEKESLEYQRNLNNEHVARCNGVLIEELEVPGMSRRIILWEDACRRLPAFARLNELIKAGAFDILICQDATRLGRRRSLIVAMASLCEEAGIRIYEASSPPGSIEGPPMGADEQLLFMFKGHQSEQEGKKFVERSRFGRQAQVRKGKHSGAPPVGLKRVFDETGMVLVVRDPEWDQYVELFYDLYLNHGRSLRAIAKEFTARGIQRMNSNSPWDVTGVACFLRNRWAYAGYASWGQYSKFPGKSFRVKAEWEPIITEEMVLWAEREMKVRAGSPRSIGMARRFSLTAECGYCGGRVTCHKANRRVIAYSCQKQCPGCYIREPVMIAAILQEIIRLRDFAYLESLIEEVPRESLLLNDDISNAEKRLESIKKERINLTRAFARETIVLDEYETLMDELKAQHDHQIQLLTGLKSQLASVHDLEKQRIALEDIRDKGIEMLNHPDVRTANTWIRQHFKLLIADNKVAAINLSK